MNHKLTANMLFTVARYYQLLREGLPVNGSCTIRHGSPYRKEFLVFVQTLSASLADLGHPPGGPVYDYYLSLPTL
jgi:hypothetical protein